MDGTVQTSQNRTAEQCNAEVFDFNSRLRNIAEGSRSDLKYLYGEIGPRLLAILVRMTGSRDIAEDLLVETFLFIWREARQFDDRRENAQMWLEFLACGRALARLSMGRPCRTHIQEH